MNNVVSIADSTSGPTGRARARWFDQAPRQWGPMADEERWLVLMLAALPSPSIKLGIWALSTHSHFGP
jgi:hypothetical protein